MPRSGTCARLRPGRGRRCCGRPRRGSRRRGWRRPPRRGAGRARRRGTCGCRARSARRALGSGPACAARGTAGRRGSAQLARAGRRRDRAPRTSSLRACVRGRQSSPPAAAAAPAARRPGSVSLRCMLALSSTSTCTWFCVGVGRGLEGGLEQQHAGRSRSPASAAPTARCASAVRGAQAAVGPPGEQHGRRQHDQGQHPKGGSEEAERLLALYAPLVAASCHVLPRGEAESDHRQLLRTDTKRASAASPSTNSRVSSSRDGPRSLRVGVVRDVGATGRLVSTRSRPSAWRTSSCAA
jgi:hypothetical protein